MIISCKSNCVLFFSSVSKELVENDKLLFCFREQQMYLAIRNIVIALWALNPKASNDLIYSLHCYKHSTGTQLELIVISSDFSCGSREVAVE